MKTNREFKQIIFVWAAGTLILLTLFLLPTNEPEVLKKSAPPVYVGYNPKCFPNLKLPKTAGKDAIEKWLEKQTCPSQEPYRYVISIEDSFWRVTRIDPGKNEEIFVVPF